MKSGVPQDLVPDLFLFPIYINDSNQAMNYHKVHHFADDTNAPHISKSVKKVNKYINIVLKNLSYGLNTHSPLLNVKKNWVCNFKYSRNKLNNPENLKSNCKKLCPSKSVKYLGINIDDNLNWGSISMILQLKLMSLMPYY